MSMNEKILLYYTHGSCEEREDDEYRWQQWVPVKRVCVNREEGYAGNKKKPTVYRSKTGSLVCCWLTDPSSHPLNKKPVLRNPSRSTTTALGNSTQKKNTAYYFDRKNNTLNTISHHSILQRVNIQ